MSLTLLLLACAPPAGTADPVATGPLGRQTHWASAQSPYVRGERPDFVSPPNLPTAEHRFGAPLGQRLEDAPTLPTPPPSHSGTALSQISVEIDDGQTGGGGEALEARLAEESQSDVSWYGVALLTWSELFGDGETPGLCEASEVLFELEEDGVAYEGSFEVEPYFLFNYGPDVVMTELGEACADALADQAGDVDAVLDAGDCNEFDEVQFFEPGSECRTCLEVDGDFARCQDEDLCLEEARLQTYFEAEGEEHWYTWMQGSLWACAPDWSLWTLIAAKVGDDLEPPAAFDHEAWGGLCIYYWDEEVGDAVMGCFSGSTWPEQGDTLGEGAFGRLNYMRVPGDSDTPHAGRMGYVHRADLGRGHAIEAFWGYSDGGAGVLSLDSTVSDTNNNGEIDSDDLGYGFISQGWGLNPAALRPDGTDPTEPDDTFARDYLAVDALKTATTVTGIWVSPANTNRCEAGAWQGPAADGSFHCSAMGVPELGWANDGEVFYASWDLTHAMAMPMTTLASTGLPDPDVPGGIAIHIAGSPALANPDWEACAWPHTFKPDTVQLEDLPGDWGGTASLTGHTYRFGKDADQDMRLIFNTNQLRGFCPEDPDFVHPSER